MKTIKSYKKYTGINANIETSLFEYGLIWIKGTKGHKNDYHFIYGVEHNGIEYTSFDWSDVPINCDIKKEYDWVRWNDVLKFVGAENEADYFKQDIPAIIYDLISYYGTENVFSGSYYPFKIGH